MEVSTQRIGILGGTFNPIHKAHIQLANAALAACDLDVVLFVVAGDPPHKQVAGNTAAAHRLAMARLAVEPYAHMEACDIELRRPGKSYSIDTLAALKSMYPGAAFFMIVGGDMLANLPNWYQAQALIGMATFVGFARAGEEEAAELARKHLEKAYHANVLLFTTHIAPYASTQIRARVAHGLPVCDMVEGSVDAYIYEEGLYLPQDVALLYQICKRDLSPRRFSHTAGVVRTAIRLAARYGVDAKAARLAALLHDYGRSVEWDALGHAVVGEKLVRETLGIQDAQVLRAILYHTTLYAGATVLDKVVYLADMIEPGRKYPGVEELREMSEVDLDLAVYHGLKRTMFHLEQKGIPVQKNSIEAAQALFAVCKEKGLL